MIVSVQTEAMKDQLRFTTEQQKQQVTSIQSIHVVKCQLLIGLIKSLTNSYFLNHNTWDNIQITYANKK